MTSKGYIETINGIQVKREYKQFTIDENGLHFYEGDVVYYKKVGSATSPFYLLNREDVPAIIKANGTTLWFKNDVLFRTDGPAAEYPDGKKVWVIQMSKGPSQSRGIRMIYSWGDENNYFFDDEESWIKKLIELKRR